ncbi:MAG: polyprenyl synthetase family protein [Acidobacteria bacterium]|nr:polyprenyl synthetase family protein [Acidobacteriota bacterium]
MAFSRIGQALTAREIRELVSAELELVEREISFESVAAVDVITAISSHLQGNGGKRLRPTVVLLSSKLCSKGAVNESAIRMGAVVEMIHAATLIHDDVIDDARTRRGKPSANVLWSNQTCVLAGDWLYMQAFQIALRERNCAVLDLLISLTQKMVQGELIQLDRIGRIDVTEGEYRKLVDKKTASLFSACARLGALVGGAPGTVEADLGEYAWSLGMAFQLVDDVLDFTARESVLGKPVGNDLREGKVTLPLILALQEATPGELEAVETVLRDRSYERVPLKSIIAFITKYRGIDRAREQARAYTAKARAIMGQFPESPYQQALLAVTDLVTDRDR